MGLFSKKSPDKTVLILDIENGSVGSGLVNLSHGTAPQLFGEQRTQVPLMDTRSAMQLARAVSHAAGESLLHASEMSARMRHNLALGPVQKVVLFMAAPWGVPNLQAGKPDFAAAVSDSIAPHIQSLFGNVPIVPHTHASAAVHGMRALYPQEGNTILLSVNGEVSELVSLQDSRVVGHATAPSGLGTVLRTLKSHAGLSEHEARSALKLGHASEALDVAAAHFAGEFKEAIQNLEGTHEATSVFVLAHEPGAEWFAKALSHRSLSDVFPKGGVVRALRNHQVAPYVSTSGIPDLHLSLDALYTAAAHR